MISKDEIAGIVEDYDRLKLRIGMTASHSALDICDGLLKRVSRLLLIVKKEGIKHMQITSKPRDQPPAELLEEWLTKDNT